MFNRDFYPTPRPVIDQMCAGIDFSGKTVLEPSAGKGDIVIALKEFGAKVIACELNTDLAIISGRKANKFLKQDFMKVTPEEISHIDFIVMNPPFSADEKHILHAWTIAPEGCQIIALCNFNTIKNPYTSHRLSLREVVKMNGSSQSLGDCFSESERETNVNIGLIRLFKPKTGESEFDGYLFDMNEEQEGQVKGSGIMRHNDIHEIVYRYVGAVKMFDTVMEANNAINGLIKPISTGLNITFGANNTQRNYTGTITRDDFKKELQKSAWRSIFGKMNMEKYVTGSVMSDINKFVEQQQHVPFTMLNIFKMIEIIIGTHSSRMDRVLTETFDYICNLSADNSEAGEKWKTNSNYKINRRFIIPSITEVGWSGEMKVRYSAQERINDIVKAMCHITGSNYDDQVTIETWFNTRIKILVDGVILPGYQNTYSHRDDWQLKNHVERLKKEGKNVDILEVGNSFGEWHDWSFFRVRGYKKGTMHFEFQDEKVWMEFNRRVSKIKGWALPTNTNSKQKGTERTRKTGVEVY